MENLEKKIERNWTDWIPGYGFIRTIVNTFRDKDFFKNSYHIPNAIYQGITMYIVADVIIRYTPIK